WRDLDAGAEIAFAAHWKLVCGGDATVKFLAGNLRPTAGPDRQLLAKRLAELNSAEFKIRDRANHDLEQWGKLIEFGVRKALDGSPSLEARRRLQLLLAKIEKLGAPIRTLRAIGVLEAIGTVPARDLLQKMAQGAPGARATRDAKASLQRLHE